MMQNQLDLGDFETAGRRYAVRQLGRPDQDAVLEVYRECEDFLASIQKGGSPRSDGPHGLQIVRALEAAQTSIRKGGQWVPV